jgi:hypothetical protein
LEVVAEAQIVMMAAKSLDSVVGLRVEAVVLVVVWVVVAAVAASGPAVST